MKSIVVAALVAAAALSIALAGIAEESETTTAPLDAKEIGRIAFPGCVLLEMLDGDGRVTGIGSGFVIREGLVATNLHVVGTAVNGRASLAGEDQPMRVLAIERIDLANDLALLRVDPPLGKSLPLAGDDLPEVGEDVFVVGSPQGLGGTLSAGIVSSIREVEGVTLIQMTAPISQGSSGGPLLDASGNVIGIAVAQWADGQNLNFAVPVRHLNAMLRFIP